jgi:hypothetical protein
MFTFFKRGSQMKCASAYLRAGKVYIHADVMTKDGIWIMNEPLLACGSKDTSALGQCILDALKGSKQGVRHPGRRKDLIAHLLQLAGVKSYNTFARLAKNVSIEQEKDRILFIPTRNGGPGTGFVPVDKKSRETHADVEDLGKMLLVAFEDCE